MRVMEEVCIGLLRPATLPLKILEFIIVVTMVEVDTDLKIPATLSLTMVEFIILVLMVELELGPKIPATLPLKIAEQELILTGEVNISDQPLFPP